MRVNVVYEITNIRVLVHRDHINCEYNNESILVNSYSDC